MPVNYGIRISQQGVDATIAQPYQLLLDERFPLFKVHMEGEDIVSLPGASSVGSKTIAHNLGYRPIVLVYGEVKDGSSKRYLINGKSPFLDFFGGDEVFMYAYVTDNDLVVEVDSGSPIGTDKEYRFHYYICYDDLEF